MHEDHDVSRHTRRKDTLSAEDLGILLQWHWKYGHLYLLERAPACANGPSNAFLRLHRQVRCLRTMILRVETPERAQQATYLLSPSRMTAMETLWSMIYST